VSQLSHNYLLLNLNKFFLNFLDSNGLAQTVELPTRGINILFNQQASLTMSCKTIDGISDHEAVIVELGPLLKAAILCSAHLSRKGLNF